MIDRIKSIVAFYKLSNRAFAIKCGLKDNTFTNQLNGVRELSLSTINAILLSFEDVSAEWLLRGTGSMFITDKPSSLETSSENAEITRLRIENNLLREMVGLNNSQKEKGKAV